MSLDHRFLGLWLSKNLSVKDQRQIFQAFQTMWSLLKLLRSAAKAATDHMKMTQHGSVSIKLYRQKQAMGWIWPEGRTLPNPDLVQFLCFLFSFPLKMVTMRSRDATDFDLQPSWAENLGLLTLRSMLLGLFWADLPRRSHCCPVPHTPSSNSQTGMSSDLGMRPLTGALVPTAHPASSLSGWEAVECPSHPQFFEGAFLPSATTAS